jgi:hypothetical protein
MIEGSLRDVPLADVFQVVVAGRKDGALQVEQEGRRATFGFEGGALHDARLDGGTHLGEVLVRLDLLSLHEVQTLLAEQRGGDARPIGAAALERGWIDAEELGRAVERQAVEVVAELVGWRDGTFRFAEGGRTPLPPEGHRVDVMRVLMEVLSEREDAGIGVDPDVVLVRVGDPTAATLPPEAWDVLALIDGHRSARAVAAETDLPEGRALAVLGRLAEAGVVDRAPDGVAPADVLVVAAPGAEARLLRLALLRAGVRPELVDDLAGASERFDALRPAAVVVDAALDPWRWLRELRRRREGAHVPVLVVGARPAGPLTAWRRPAADVLPRPFRELDLHAWVTGSVGRTAR